MWGLEDVELVRLDHTLHEVARPEPRGERLAGQVEIKPRLPDECRRDWPWPPIRAIADQFRWT
jgi:hypothetical protein